MRLSFFLRPSLRWASPARLALIAAAGWSLGASVAPAQQPVESSIAAVSAESSDGVQFSLSDDGAAEQSLDPSDIGQGDFAVPAQPVSLKQPGLTPQIASRSVAETTQTGTSAEQNIASLRTSTLQSGSQSQQGTAQSVGGAESQSRGASDTGDLLGKSPSVLGVGTQRRTPVVNDPRIRGSRIGSLAAAGSYWVPARIDLDTAVNKIDSHIIQDVTVIKGPYSALYGPGSNFIVIDLLDSPRFVDGPEIHSSTELVYKTNGEQLFGRETIWGGDATTGYRANYVHRIGNDYESGDGTEFNASYNMREFDIALGHTFQYGGYVEFNYLRLDQTNLEYPGQAFDLDFLVTDGFEFEAGLVDEPYFDKLAAEFWFNSTQFEGTAAENKYDEFIALQGFNYRGRTDVYSASTGYRLFAQWGDPLDDSLTIGTDMRVIKQNLEEVASGRIGTNTFVDANSPIPKSYSIDPGVYVERFVALEEHWRVRWGARASWTSTRVLEDVGEIGNYNSGTQPRLEDVLGTSELNQSFTNLGAFITSDYDLDDQWTASGAIGVNRRPPSLTELYAAQPFMFLIQNGLNTVTGDPRLTPETMAQVDLGVTYQVERLSGGLTGFHTWGIDYITFENIGENQGQPLGRLVQTNLQYVNTDLATFTGFEAFLQYEATDWLSPFATVSYVDGRDRDRNGDFATQAVQAGPVASTRDPDLNRGNLGGNAADINGPALDQDEEPLPGILPMDARIGFRLHPAEQQLWGYELSARVVSTQNRVALSLNEARTIGYTVWDMRGFWQIRPNVLLLGGIENFTDNNYNEHLDFRSDSYILFQPGINFYAGSEISF